MLVLSAALVLGCGRERPPDVTQRQPDWDALNDSLPEKPAVQARMLESYRQSRGVLMWFLPGSDTAGVRQLNVDLKHRCAPAIPAFVQRIPLDDAVLRTLRVLETDSTGQILARWQIPAGVTITGVRGNTLVTSVGERPADVNFLISPDGGFTIDKLEYRRAARPIWPQRVCPAGPEFAELSCAEFRDDDRRRLILHPPPCGGPIEPAATTQPAPSASTP